MTSVLNPGGVPTLKYDQNHNIVQESGTDRTFRGTYIAMTNNIEYIGLARPGTAEGALAWQLSKLTYDGSNNLLTIKYPQNASGVGSSEYAFSWSAHAFYTYS